MSPALSNLLTTLISCAVTGLLGFYTARLTARVQQQATAHQARSTESERAWKRADDVEHDADHWRAEWANEARARAKAEARVEVLEARVAVLEGRAPTPSPNPQV